MPQVEGGTKGREGEAEGVVDGVKDREAEGVVEKDAGGLAEGEAVTRIQALPSIAQLALLLPSGLTSSMHPSTGSGPSGR